MPEKQEFYPCEKSTCRFYGEWILKCTENNTGLTLPARGIQRAHAATSYITNLGLCLTCVYFKKHNNFILR